MLIEKARPGKHLPRDRSDALSPQGRFMEPPAPVVQIEGLTKRYGDFEAVTGLTMHVGRGELFALLGPNGAGKTTTIRMLIGVLQPSAGTARVAGFDCFTDRVEVMRRAGYLPDEPIFHDYLRGMEIVRFVGEMHGLRRAEIDARSGPLFERLGLSDATDEYAVNYSRGMKKKLALVCALLHDPVLLILDEPTNGLDPYATRTLHEMMRERTAAGNTVFFSTHLLDQAERLCQRIGILSRGRLAACGTLDALRAADGGARTLEDIFFAATGEQPDREAETVEGAAHGAAG